MIRIYREREKYRVLDIMVKYNTELRMLLKMIAGN